MSNVLTGNDRPYVFCHMSQSLDGKIIGNWMDIPEAKESHTVFYDIAFGKEPHYQHRGWISGRETTDYNFTGYRKPDLSPYQDVSVDAGDWVRDYDLPMYYISLDRRGVLAWNQPTARFKDTEAQVLEVLTESVDSAYRAYLRNRGIPYIICGERDIDWALLLRKLKHDFHMDTVMLGGGGAINWSLIQAGLCDEVSLVIGTAADGSPHTPSVFHTVEGLSSDRPVGFELIDHQVFPQGTLWLRYKIGKIYESATWKNKG